MTIPIPQDQQPAGQNPAVDQQQPDAGDAAEMLPRAEMQKAFRARDAAKQQARRATAALSALASRFGLGADDLEVVDGEGGAVDVRGERLEHLAKVAAEASDKVPFEEKAQQLRAQEQKKYAAKLSKYEAYIEKQAVENNLRDALLSAGATPDGIKQAVQLMRQSVKKEIVFDDESGEMKVVLTGHDEDGTPLLNGSGDAPADLTRVAERWLRANPIFAKAKFRRGPGAGGMAPAHMGGQPVQPMTPEERGRLAGAAVFGQQFAMTKEQQRSNGLANIFGPRGNGR